ncbi:hypothetical protein [Dyella sp.]|uniref:hypothetical protein n=1 Tax=Dyella sp. TaxID=1869338 RepID=UPI002ED5C0BB
MSKLLRYIAVLGVLVSGAALAQSPSSGLGQSWPNAPDQSSSARYHVYVFVKDGVRFIQVNDAAGNVRGAVAAAGGQFLTLPVGSATQVVTQDPTTVRPTSGERIYQDDQVRITAQPQKNGTLLLQAASACDPVDCTTHAQ